jgi:hypothetical protein
MDERIKIKRVLEGKRELKVKKQTKKKSEKVCPFYTLMHKKIAVMSLFVFFIVP